ncbi:hypothetical protein PV377_03115 [Streptomyces ipomoeae]|uniref:hypothetical protein n=1 Tax=Streptomyces ipomoeae TaxID=103232 RepID=UPI0029B3A8A7|nr:hypothetical protein [Streptomyces ipomoeae]MDX2838003.1 hypothetical protein [Streptomyces ipomoeae]
MDLHAWITQQVDWIEASLEGRRVVFERTDGGPALAGTVTGVWRTPDGLQLDIARYGVEPRDETSAPAQSVNAVLRRCESDRRILNRHRLDPDQVAFPAACEGCGRDEWGLPNTENVNDCPELLDLAHAHGITPEILAGLDQPQAPEPKPHAKTAHTPSGARRIAQLIATPPITTSDVPAALRGPRWKP